MVFRMKELDYLLLNRCRVPIIENTEQECVLTDRLKSAIIAYPRAQGHK